MALSTRLAPVKPVSPKFGGQGASACLTLPMAASTAVVDGDVVVMTAGLAVPHGNDPAVDVIVGFANGTKASSADVDFILVWPAFPDSLFEGNMVGGTDTDYTGAIADMAPAVYGLTTATSGAVNKYTGAAVNQADTTAPVAVPLYYTRQANGTLGIRSGIGIVNPRVAFVVMTTLFSQLS